MLEGVEAGHAAGQPGVRLVHPGEGVVTLVTARVAETLRERVGLNLEFGDLRKIFVVKLKNICCPSLHHSPTGSGRR